MKNYNLQMTTQPDPTPPPKPPKPPIQDGDDKRGRGTQQ